MIRSGLRERLRLRRHVRRLRRSGLLDEAWYRSQAPDVELSGFDPATHYLLLGARQGRDPSPRFSTTSYLEANRDVAAAGLNPLLHYLMDGWAHGRPLGAALHAPALPPAAVLGWQDRLRRLCRPFLRPKRRLRPIMPDASGMRILIEPVRGPLPTGWVLMWAHGLRRGQSVPVHTLLPDGIREFRVVAGDDGATLVRLPDIPARLGLPPEAAGLADRLRVRELGDIEGLIRAVIAERPSWRRVLRAVRERRAGVTGSLTRRLGQRYAPDEADAYSRWIKLYDSPSSDHERDMRQRAARIAGQTSGAPHFSIIVPVYNTPAPVLREMIASVRAQIYPRWELCLADDGSTAPATLAELRHIGHDRRIKLHRMSRNGGISAASNAALAMSSGDWIALLDHDDTLAPHALLVMAEAIAANPGADMFYSDEDKLNAEGTRYDPYFKPEFNIELMQGQNFVCHLGVYRADMVRALGGLRSDFDGSQDYDLALRVANRTRGPVVHIPHVLYHWRQHPRSGSFSVTHIDKATAAARRAIEDAAATQGEPVQVVASHSHFHRIVRPAPATWPRISVIIPTRDHADVLQACLRGLREKTDYPSLEIIIADNDSSERETLDLFERLSAGSVRILPCPGEFNYAAINNRAAAAATGELLLLLNNDVTMIEPGWLKEMVSLTRDRDVGAVGAKLLYPDGTLQHGGVVLGIGGVAGHVYVNMPGDYEGYFSHLMLTREVSAVTAACMLMPARHFHAVGGFDAANLAVAFNDVDLCLRLRAAGLRILWTPHAVLHHWESKSRGLDTSGPRLERFRRETGYMTQRWGETLRHDSFYSPNLSLETTTPGLAFPPRVARPWDEAQSADE